MHRRYRLTSSTEFERVRRHGKSYAHPLAVLIASPSTSQSEVSRFGIVAGRSVGTAVHRNRAKRRLREALRPWLAQVEPGWDVLILARAPMAESTFDEVARTVRQLLERARLISRQP